MEKIVIAPKKPTSTEHVYTFSLPLPSSTFLLCGNFQIAALERTLSGCLLSIFFDFTPFPVKLISSQTWIRVNTSRHISPNVGGIAKAFYPRFEFWGGRQTSHFRIFGKNVIHSNSDQDIYRRGNHLKFDVANGKDRLRV